MFGLSLSAGGRAGGSSSSYLLDSYGTGISHASSFFKLSSSYSGQCCRIRRSSDNAETDIGFNGDFVDTAAISSFVGANDGFIITRYDQSGLGNNRTQATAIDQPYIVRAGTLQVDSNGNLAEDNTGESRFTLLPSLTVDSVFVYHEIGTDSKGMLFAAPGTAPYLGTYDSGSTSTTLNASSGSNDVQINDTSYVSGVTQRNQLHPVVQNLKFIFSSTGNTATATYAVNGYGSGFHNIGKHDTLLTYSTDQSSNRTGILAILYDLHSITP